MQALSIYWPTALLLIMTLALLVAPVVKHSLLLAMSVGIVLATTVYYMHLHVKSNTLQYFSDTHTQSIRNALKSETKNEKHSLLFCNAMLNQFSTQPSPETALLNTADCYDQNALNSIAADITRYILKHNPSHPPALYAIAKAHLKTHGMDSIEFINALNVLLTSAPEHPDGLWLLSAHQYYKGDYQSALNTLNQLEPLIKHNKDTHSTEQKLNKLAQFKGVIEQALAGRPN